MPYPLNTSNLKARKISVLIPTSEEPNRIKKNERLRDKGDATEGTKSQKKTLFFIADNYLIIKVSNG